MNKESANTQTIWKLENVEWFLAQTPLKNKAEFCTTQSAFFIENHHFVSLRNSSGPIIILHNK